MRVPRVCAARRPFLALMVLSTAATYFTVGPSTYQRRMAANVTTQRALSQDQGLPQDAAWQYSYVNPETRERGRAMSVEAGKVYKNLNISENDYANELTTDTAAEFVFVTGASRNHFKECQGAVNSIQQAFPNKPILYYDLGLLPEQRKTVQSYCNVKLVVFDYNRYPAHVRRKIHTKAFKLLVIAEALNSFPGIFWFDASARFSPHNFSKIYEKAVASRGFLMFHPSFLSIFATSHRDMYTYFFPTDPHKLEEIQIESNVMLIFRTPFTLVHIVQPAVHCSLDPQCIDPMATDSVLTCKLIANWQTRDKFLGCVRYDQAVLNILALNAYQYHQEAFHYKPSFVTIQRGLEDLPPNKTAFPVQLCG